MNKCLHGHWFCNLNIYFFHTNKWERWLSYWTSQSEETNWNKKRHFLFTLVHSDDVWYDREDLVDEHAEHTLTTDEVTDSSDATFICVWAGEKMVVRSNLSFSSSISSNYFSINIFTHNWLSTDLRPNQSQSNLGPQWIYSIICDTQSLTFSQRFLWLLVSALEVVYPYIEHRFNVIVLKNYISWKPFQKVLERPYVLKYYKIITVTHLRVAWQTKPDGKTFLLAAQLLLRQVHSDIGLQRRQTFKLQDNRSAKIRLKILRHIVCGAQVR